MKKFSWIFALILALSMAFVFTGCPGPDEDTPPPPDSGTKPVVPPNPANIVVTFGEGSGKTEVLPGNNGTIEYTSAGGYTYTYGTVADSNYGNGIVRFKVDLGDKTLDDYGKVSFKWSTEGYKDDGDNASSNKKLYLLASVSGSALEPYKSDAAIKELVVSTDIFDTAPSTNFYSNDSPAPLVNGNDEQVVELPIVAEKVADLIGEVWFSIYLHAGTGKYTVSNLVFVAGPYVAGETTNPGPDADSKPVVVVPGVAKSFDLNLLNCDTTNSTVGGTPVTPTDAGGGAITAAFTANDQRLNIALTDEQYGIINSRVDNRVKIEVDGEIVTNGDGDDSGDLFRYHIGDIVEGGGWNTTNPGVNNTDFDGILGVADLQLNEDNKSNNGVYSSRPKYFILQHRNSKPITVKLTKITITVYVDEKAPAAYLNAVGMQKELVADPDVIGFYGDGGHSFEHGVLTIDGHGGFSVAFPDGVAATDKFDITYIYYLSEGTSAQFTRKQESGWADVNVSDLTGDDKNNYLYNSLNTANEVKTIEVDLSRFSEAGFTAGKAFFQTNGSFVAKMKIISVEKQD